MPATSGNDTSRVSAAVFRAALSSTTPATSCTTVISNSTSTQRCGVNSHGVARASTIPVAADALAGAVSSRVSTWCAAVTAPADTFGLVPGPCSGLPLWVTDR
ncbi:hypothetical protein GCM10023175_29950 [Pseudonocardia xishanensis]|uniref:Uncharacterized protein n=1 Tax=Pseudonocardia xishanensis TaxID=630995 RepID=A0ABP8RS07_9PSEU